MSKENLTLFQKKLQEKKIDFFILPNSDQFFLEYLPEFEKKIQFLTGFNGSNAVLIAGRNKIQFFTDGRYILQAKNQLNKDKFNIIDMASKSIFTWLEENVKKSQKVAINVKNFSVNAVEKMQKTAQNKGFELLLFENDIIDEIWQKRPKKPDSAVFHHKIQYSGVESAKKIAKISKKIENAFILSDSESICWLLNIRASDIQYSPLLACYAIIYKNNEIDLFIDKKRLKKGCFQGLEVNYNEFSLSFNQKTAKKLKKPKINIINPENFPQRIRLLSAEINSLEIDEKATNYWVLSILKKNKIAAKDLKNPVLIAKAVKNSVEIKNAVKAHEIDGLAVTKFLFWLEKSIEKGEKIDELKCEDKLLKLRQKHKNFYYPSFRSISGFGSNGAIIHYAADKKSNKTFKGNSLYLIDSGGQYDFSTTDITRTVAINAPSQEMKNDFTLVLKGHIALATSEFDEKTSGAKLDFLARKFLLKENKDYAHGTGHGVGSFLSVHEGPVSISRNSVVSTFKSGMILSNEPGFYKEGEYGIRIENLVLIKKYKQKLSFKTLTMAPIDMNLIEKKLLNKKEKEWLKKYHNNIFNLLKNKINNAEKPWLKRFCDFYKNI